MSAPRTRHPTPPQQAHALALLRPKTPNGYAATRRALLILAESAKNEDRTIYAGVVQVMADVFGAAVYQFEVSNSASLGAALRAAEADAAARGQATAWEDVVRGLAEPVAASRIRPDPAHTATYRELRQTYAACEAHALGRGPTPALQGAEPVL